MLIKEELDYARRDILSIRETLILIVLLGVISLVMGLVMWIYEKINEKKDKDDKD